MKAIVTDFFKKKAVVASSPEYCSQRRISVFPKVLMSKLRNFKDSQHLLEVVFRGNYTRARNYKIQFHFGCILSGS